MRLIGSFARLDLSSNKPSFQAALAAPLARHWKPSVLCQASWHANLTLDADGIPFEDEPPYALHFVLLLDRVPPAAFAKGAARGTDVGVTLTGGRLTATLTGEDWPGAEPATPLSGITTTTDKPQDLPDRP